MSRVPAPFGDVDFWRWYHALDDWQEHELPAELRPALPNLSAQEDSRSASVWFHIGDGTTLVLDLSLEFWHLNLALETPDGSSSELGWWDEARWHPFALRWEEVQALVRVAGHELGDDVALCLLAPFVGTDTSAPDQLEQVRNSVKGALDRLGIDEQTATRLAESAVRPVAGEEYQWTRHPELGWVFGGEYPCYSLRNQAHAGGAEGQFPFAAMAKLRHELGLET